MSISYDVFSGEFHKLNSQWMNFADNFDQAYEMMVVLADHNPGPYFIFDRQSRKSVAEVGTAAKQASYAADLP